MKKERGKKCKLLVGNIHISKFSLHGTQTNTPTHITYVPNQLNKRSKLNINLLFVVYIQEMSKRILLVSKENNLL